MTAPTFPVKPLGRKAYGSIGHLPCSRMGPADHHVTEGQARICTEKARDKRDRIIVQEKLDGSCVAVAMLGGTLIPLGRAGYPAISSQYEMHRLFAAWVFQNEDRFRRALREGERICGEWLAQAHGTIYRLDGAEPFAAFDIMRDDKRIGFDDFRCRVEAGGLSTPTLLSDGEPITVEAAMAEHANMRYCHTDEVEGVVYRVERDGKVDFLAKYVRPDKVDGKYLDGEPIWLWRGSLANIAGKAAWIGHHEEKLSGISSKAAKEARADANTLREAAIALLALVPFGATPAEASVEGPTPSLTPLEYNHKRIDQ